MDTLKIKLPKKKKHKALMPSEPMTIGEQLRFYRKAQGIFIDNIAKKKRVSKYIMNSLEDDLGTPSVDALVRYANELGCTIIVVPMPRFSTNFIPDRSRKVVAGREQEHPFPSKKL